MVLQFLELLDHLRRQQFRPRAHDLPEFHKRGAEIFEGEPYSLIDRGSFRYFSRLLRGGEPEAGPGGKQPLKPETKTILAQNVDDLRIPPDTGDHGYW